MVLERFIRLFSFQETTANTYAHLCFWLLWDTSGDGFGEMLYISAPASIEDSLAQRLGEVREAKGMQMHPSAKEIQKKPYSKI